MKARHADYKTDYPPLTNSYIWKDPNMCYISLGFNSKTRFRFSSRSFKDGMRSCIAAAMVEGKYMKLKSAR